MTVRRTTAPRMFTVEIREKGAEPKIVADQVSLGVARTICRELVRPSVYAVVRRVDAPVAPADEPKRQYAVWLWDTQTRCWDRATEAMDFGEAYRWVKSWERDPVECVALVWPDWATDPPMILEAVA